MPTNKEIALQGVKANFIDLDVDAAKSLIAESYIQHNPMSPLG